MTVATSSAAGAASTRAAPASSKGAGGSSSSSKAKGQKGSVVFTSIYGCHEGATGVGPVCSILEVRDESAMI